MLSMLGFAEIGSEHVTSSRNDVSQVTTHLCDSMIMDKQDL